MGAGFTLLSTTISPGAGDMRWHGVLVALLLPVEVVDEEVDESVNDDVDEDVNGKVVEAVEESADEEVDKEVDKDVEEDVDEELDEVSVDEVDEDFVEVDNVEVARTVELVVPVAGTLVDLAILIQEHPLDILDCKPEHTDAHTGSVAKVVAVVYVEQNEAAAAEERIMIRCKH